MSRSNNEVESNQSLHPLASSSDPCSFELLPPPLLHPSRHLKHLQLLPHQSPPHHHRQDLPYYHTMQTNQVHHHHHYLHRLVPPLLLHLLHSWHHSRPYPHHPGI